MTERHRALPSWMAKKEGKVKEKEPLRSARKRKAARAAFYCMNEKELVDAAFSCLTDAAREDVALPADRKVEDKAAATTVNTREDPATAKKTAKLLTLAEQSSDEGDALDATCVSETDMEISPGHLGPEGQRAGPGQDHGGSEAEEKEEDDALRLVREIFFAR
ncbi:cell cycle regulator of non-homologous end joining [Pungitius pungitius]|uniref:cell cycle regulator of non-homologous end joining n=1 Tax=Pungitius pungitius TaxID=134920 RepID=UPI002E10429D